MSEINNNVKAKYIKKNEEYLKLKKEYDKVINCNKRLCFEQNRANAECKSLKEKFKVNKYNYQQLSKQYNALYEEHKAIKKKQINYCNSD